MSSLYKIKLIIVSLFLTASIVSCKKFVTVDLPVTALITASVFSNDATATAAQTAIYSQMSSGESYLMALNTGLLSDELKNYSNDPGRKEFYTNSMDPITIGINTGCWSSAYNYIYQSNAIIEGLQAIGGTSLPIRQQLTGESKFLRAFWYFYLTNCYGDVPLITDTGYVANSRAARVPQNVIYQQILTDLKDAQGLLNNNFVDLSDTTITTEKVRPTKTAANALMARTYLYLGKYDSAEIESNLVINNSGISSIEPDLNQVFKANSQEAIWQLQIPLPAYQNTSDGANFILLGTPNNVSISKQLLNSFETGDARRIDWIHDTVFAGQAYSYPYKYKVQTGSDVSEYVMVLRLAEQYLIRAEARAQNGNISGPNGALSDLNVIRERAGLTDYAGDMGRDSVLKAIFHERQVELFTEWGNRWFDLRRTGFANSVMSIVAPLKGGAWNNDGHQLLFPIPQTERSKDLNLTQNAGY